MGHINHSNKYLLEDLSKKVNMEYAPLWLGGFYSDNVGFGHLYSASASELRPLT